MEVTTERDTPRIQVSPPPEETSFSFGSDVTARFADESQRDLKTTRDEENMPERKPLFTLSSDPEDEA